jgi:uracil-DNA glycosylase
MRAASIDRYGYQDVAMDDGPKTLGNPEVRRARLEMLREPHIAPLTAFVDEIRRERAASGADPSFRPEYVPYLDPMDGGIDARALFLQEAPGRRAVTSGFVSRNNPDETAKNNYVMQEDAGLRREDAVRWNIVPWYIGNDDKIRAALGTDLQEGRPYLSRFLELLPRLEFVVLLGKNAQLGWDRAHLTGSWKIFRTHHLSPLALNTSPERRRQVFETFVALAAAMART